VRGGYERSIVIIASLLVACSEDPRPTPSAPPVEPVEAAADGYRVVELGDAGSISGQLRWTGELPAIPSFDARTDRDECGASHPSRALRVSGRGGVADAVIEIVSPSAGGPLERPAQPVTVSREGCRFEPHVAVVGVGWPIEFTSADDVVHNVSGTLDGRRVLDLGLPRAGASARGRVREPGLVRLVCDAGHGWEHAWLRVLDHPYAVVSDEDGRFRISNVPPGQYALRVWHEGWLVTGTRAGRPTYSNPVILHRTVSVSPRQETTVDFELSQQSAEIAGG